MIVIVNNVTATPSYFNGTGHTAHVVTRQPIRLALFTESSVLVLYLRYMLSLPSRLFSARSNFRQPQIPETGAYIYWDHSMTT